ncbi:Pkinase-domain-containing protein, partial [Metschnikowia bicuspidata]
QLENWLAKSSCQQYLDRFLANDLTFDLLAELDSNAIRELGISKLGDRLRLEFAVQELKAVQLKSKVLVDRIRSAVAKTSGHSKITPAQLELLERGQGQPERSVTFILPDGSLEKVELDGCFNALIIKLKVLRQLGAIDDQSMYQLYVHTNSGNGISIQMLYDLEFVSICFSPTNTAKNRIMLTSKDSPPCSQAIRQSLRIFQRTAGRIPGSTPMKTFYGQRPPSELISSNLGEYFPQANIHELETTIRNSVRYSKRMLKRLNLSGMSSVLLALHSLDERDQKSVPSGPTIGDVLLQNEMKIDKARLVCDALLIFSGPKKMSSIHEADPSDLASVAPSVASVAPPAETTVALAGAALLRVSRKRFLVAALFSTAENRISRIELMDSDSSDDDDIVSQYADDNVSCISPRFSDVGKWVKGSKIGAGSFGTVYLGVNPMTGELMAVKQVPISGQKAAANGTDLAQTLNHEVSLLKELNHENIVQYFGLSSENGFINIFLEYVPGGSVSSLLKLFGSFEEPLIRTFIRQVLVGLSYLHGKDIIHRDIKGANILVDIKGVVKISDFGVSKKLGQDDHVGDDEHKPSKRSSLQGLVYWMAPEVVKQTTYTKKADVWSVACLVIEMFTGSHPYPGFTQMQAIYQIGTFNKPEIPAWCSDDGKAFLAKTLDVDCEKRLSAVELLAEPFLSNLVV